MTKTRITLFIVGLLWSTFVFAQTDARIINVDTMAAIPIREGKIAGMSVAAEKVNFY